MATKKDGSTQSYGTLADLNKKLGNTNIATTSVPFDKNAYAKAHANTTDDATGKVIAVNGQNTASVNSPYNPSNMQSDKMVGNLASAISGQPIESHSMGTQAASNQDNLKSTDNTLKSKYVAPQNGTGSATSSNTAPITQPVGSTGLLGKSSYKSPGQIADEKAIADVKNNKSSDSSTDTSSSDSTDTTRAGLLSRLANQDWTQNPMALKAQGDYSTAVQNLSDFNQKMAAAYGNVENSPIPVEFQQGREQVMARQAASTQSALQEAVQQQQAQMGYAQTGQGLQQSALGTALGARAPISQFGVYIDPITGQTVSGGSAQSVAFGGGQTQASVGMGSEYANNDASQRGAINQVQQLTGLDMSNQTNIPALTTILQNWQNEGISGPNAQKLSNTLSAINSAYSSILKSTIDVSAMAKSSGKTIGEVLQNLNDLANSRQAALKSSAMNGGTSGVTTPSTTSGGGMFDW